MQAGADPGEDLQVDLTGVQLVLQEHEAAVLLAGALAAYSTTGQPWWLVPALILLPDLAWAGIHRRDLCRI